MGIGEIAASTAVDLVKSENIQNKAVSLLGMLFPYAGIEKRALDMYLSDVEKSDMSPESKLIATLSAKTTIKKLKNQKVLPTRQSPMRKRVQSLMRLQALIMIG